MGGRRRGWGGRQARAALRLQSAHVHGAALSPPGAAVRAREQGEATICWRRWGAGHTGFSKELCWVMQGGSEELPGLGTRQAVTSIRTNPSDGGEDLPRVVGLGVAQRQSACLACDGPGFHLEYHTSPECPPGLALA